MAERVKCVVTLCRRTTRPGSGEWICEKHWLGVARPMRVWLAKAQAEHRRKPTATSEQVRNSAWNECKAQAIRAGAGVGEQDQ